MIIYAVSLKLQQSLNLTVVFNFFLACRRLSFVPYVLFCSGNRVLSKNDFLSHSFDQSYRPLSNSKSIVTHLYFTKGSVVSMGLFRISSVFRTKQYRP